jgi:hypothetical protein
MVGGLIYTEVEDMSSEILGAYLAYAALAYVIGYLLQLQFRQSRGKSYRLQQPEYDGCHILLRGREYARRMEPVALRRV